MRRSLTENVSGAGGAMARCQGATPRSTATRWWWGPICAIAIGKLVNLTASADSIRKKPGAEPASLNTSADGAGGAAPALEASTFSASAEPLRPSSASTNYETGRGTVLKLTMELLKERSGIFAAMVRLPRRRADCHRRDRRPGRPGDAGEHQRHSARDGKRLRRSAAPAASGWPRCPTRLPRRDARPGLRHGELDRHLRALENAAGRGRADQPPSSTRCCRKKARAAS